MVLCIKPLSGFSSPQDECRTPPDMQAFCPPLQSQLLHCPLSLLPLNNFLELVPTCPLLLTYPLYQPLVLLPLFSFYLTRSIPLNSTLICSQHIKNAAFFFFEKVFHDFFPVWMWISYSFLMLPWHPVLTPVLPAVTASQLPVYKSMSLIRLWLFKRRVSLMFLFIFLVASTTPSMEQLLIKSCWVKLDP